MFTKLNLSVPELECFSSVCRVNEDLRAHDDGKYIMGLGVKPFEYISTNSDLFIARLDDGQWAVAIFCKNPAWQEGWTRKTYVLEIWDSLTTALDRMLSGKIPISNP
jgi:hypothetical protein